MTVLGSLGSEDAIYTGNGYLGTSSFLLEDDAALEDDASKILLDAGFRAHPQLKLRQAYRDLDAIFISHMHEDHMADLVTMAQHLTFELRLKGIPLYGPPHLEEKLRDRTKRMEYREDIFQAFDIHELVADHRVDVGTFAVTPHRVIHREQVAYAFRIAGSKNTLGYSGDTGAGETGTCEGLLKALDGVDLALVEAFAVESPYWMKDLHMSGAEAGEHARRAGAQRLVITHMKYGADTRRILADAREHFGGEVEPAIQDAIYTMGPLRSVSVARASRVLAGEKLQTPGRLSKPEMAAMNAAFLARFPPPPSLLNVVNERTR